MNARFFEAIVPNYTIRTVAPRGCRCLWERWFQRRSWYALPQNGLYVTGGTKI